MTELAGRIDELSMGAPVMLFLSAHKPLAFLAGQFMQSLEPLVDLFDLPMYSEIATLLNTPGGIEHMENALQQASDRRNAGRGAESERAHADRSGIDA